jgi:predicted Zn-dependent peptidase
MDKNYHATDLISDILSNGDSSRLYTNLVKSKKIFSEIQAYISGDIDEGLFIFSGKLIKGVDIETANRELEMEIDKIRMEKVSDFELEKVKNKIESNLEYSELSALNKAINLSYSELLGDANLVNEEIDLYNSVSAEQINEIAKSVFAKENGSTLYYLAN